VRYTVSLKDKDISKMDISFIFCSALFLYFTFSIQGEKRILLNNPDVVAERLNRIEQKVNILETDNLQQKQTVANLKAENLQLEQRLQQSSHLIQNLQSSISKLQSMYFNIIIIRCSTNSLFRYYSIVFSWGTVFL